MKDSRLSRGGISSLASPSSWPHCIGFRWVGQGDRVQVGRVVQEDREVQEGRVVLVGRDVQGAWVFCISCTALQTHKIHFCIDTDQTSIAS